MRIDSWNIVIGALVLFSTLVFACSKEEKITHLEGRVEGNNHPPFDGISKVLIDNYVNRYYIDLIGISPDDSTLNGVSQQLIQTPLDIDLRASLIENAIDDTIYFDRFFSVTSLKFIEGFERKDLMDRQLEYEVAKDLAENNGDSLLVQVIEFEIIKMDSLIQAADRLETGEIDLKAFFRAFCFNYVYDEINMGSLNFVVACFENLFGRGPTANEQDRSIAMVDGASSFLFSQSGNSKSDFLSIMLNSPEFEIGRAKDIYTDLLQRQPDTNEEIEAVGLIRNAPNLKAIQVNIAKSEEYAGF